MVLFLLKPKAPTVIKTLLTAPENGSFSRFHDEDTQ